jgi:hypothetical protein
MTLYLSCTLVAAAKAPPLDSPINSMHLSKSNVYQTLVLVWHDAPSAARSIDTFVQLASLHFSGLIAIVRSEKARLCGFMSG